MKIYNMKTYSTFNVVLFILAVIFLPILLVIEFDSTLLTLAQLVGFIVIFLVLHLTNYDFRQFYDENIKEK